MNGNRGSLNTDQLAQKFELFPAHRQNILLKALHFQSQAVIGPGKHLTDVAQINEKTLMNTAEAVGGKPFFIFSDEEVFHIVLLDSMDKAASAGGFDINDFSDFHKNNGFIDVDRQTAKGRRGTADTAVRRPCRGEDFHILLTSFQNHADPHRVEGL